jgi:transposase
LISIARRIVRLGVCVARPKPWEVEDGLWERIEPLLPKVERRFRYPGRKRLDDRAALCGILFVLYTGVP